MYKEILFIILATITICSCATTTKDILATPEVEPKEKVFNQYKHFEISINETFQIDLNSNPTTGYAWEWVNRNTTNTVDSIGWDYLPNNNSPDIVGGGGKEIWKFKGLQKGLDTINMKYRRPWDPNDTADSALFIIHVFQ